MIGLHFFIYIILYTIYHIPFIFLELIRINKTNLINIIIYHVYYVRLRVLIYCIQYET